jgi:hypothetical protein
MMVLSPMPSMTTASSFIGPSSPRCVGWIGGPNAPCMDSGGHAVMFRRPALLSVPLRFAPESHISRFGACAIAAIVPDGIAQKTLRALESVRCRWDVVGRREECGSCWAGRRHVVALYRTDTVRSPYVTSVFVHLGLMRSYALE